MELSSNSPGEREPFLVNVEGRGKKFQRGLLTMPVELSEDNYKQTFNDLSKVGMICKAKSAPMSILGSTIGAACDDYIFRDDGGQWKILPASAAKE